MKDKLRTRADLLRRVRSFFDGRGVLEVITPVLSRAAGTDPAIEPLKTRYTGPGHPQGLELYLQTSPEFPMKRLLAAGSGPVYQIAQVFRDGEYGPRHNPEFSLLEWYRPGFDHHALMGEVAELVIEVLQMDLPIEKIAYVDLFREHLGWHPLEAELSMLEARARELDLLVEGITTRDQWLDLFMSLVIEPQLGNECLTFIYDYPASQASLARISPDDSALASRFELYYRGVELANGFHELTDAREQRRRFEQENLQRQHQGQRPMPVDEYFLAALEAGLPDCAGVALGLDRLLMLKLNVSCLDDVLSFSLKNA
ncbi:EF-P lysine aminoacylase EpmA [Thiolapillus brandeum]|uniref:EF-P lysine aminoacylase EpmA n=1 Tax=Thiolapillus brandeum TaxID=1076588 RepID=UPI000A8723FA|nr:EF-P lysine aminoacylase EpmA [Thiolapillus brandeum]